MRFREVLRFEVEQQARQPATWIYLALLLGTTLLIADGADPVGTGTLFNAPVKVATFSLFVGLLGTLVTAGLFVDAAHRDLRWRMHPLFCAVPLRKGEYLSGRFAGALLVNGVLLVAVPAGLLLGAWGPLASAEALGPFRTGSYLVPYAVFLLPNVFVTAAVLFGVTVLARRSLPGYLGALGLFAAYLLAANTIARPGTPPALALLDPTGAAAVIASTSGWTRIELDTRPVPLAGIVLWNRLLWVALGAAMLAFAHSRFRLAHAEPGRRRRRREGLAGAEVAPAPAARGTALGAFTPVSPPPRAFGARTRVRQLLAAARLANRQTVLSRDFLLVTLGLIALAIFAGLETVNTPTFGAPVLPLTHLVAATLSGRVLGIVVALLTIFFAGELVWRERDAGIEQMGDTLPVPSWVPLAGKIIALAAMLVVVQAVLMVSGIVLQAVHGYYRFELGLYLQLFLGIALIDYLLVAALALLVHVVVNQKYVGHVAGVLTYLAILQAPRFGLEHNLLIYASDPGVVYSELAGFGPFVAPFVWLKGYWVGWALLLGVVAFLFWVRGTELGMRERIRLARQRLRRRVRAFAGATAVLVLGTGGFIFYNTDVLNIRRTGRESNEVEAEYERRYKRFEHAPQPWLTGMRLHVELYPERREVTVRGSYQLVNRTGEPIDSIHLSSFPYLQLVTRRIRFDRAADAVLEDGTHGYRIFTLARPLAPGDSLQLDFEVGLERRGFMNHGGSTINTAVVENGTYLEMFRVLPALGYQRELLELTDPVARREHGLPPRSPFRPLDDSLARRIPRSSPHADWIAFEGTVGTSGDQIAVLPGTLQRSWREGGRRYFQYRTDTPVLPSLGVVSARYAVREERWMPSSAARSEHRPALVQASVAKVANSPVELRVLHHPGHSVNVDRILQAAKASLDYFVEQFGPYPHRQLSLIEIPRYNGTFGRAHPGAMVYTEGHPIAIARVEGDDDADAFQTPFLVIAHEIAHQWWGHQMMGADVEGSQVLSETLAQYSALMVLERAYGAAAAHRFARSMQLGYLDGRGSHDTPEVPLLRSSDHDYIHYRKGAAVMYALREYIGEEQINAALRGMVRKYGLTGPPYPTSLDLYRELQAVTADSLRPLLDDLFATITLWDLRATGARAEPAGDGAYRLTLDVDAAKVRSDSVGNDEPVPMDDLVEIGVFAEPAEGERLGEPVYLRKHRIRSGRQTITITVPTKPAHAGIDPHHTLIARHFDALLSGKVIAVQ